MVQAKGPACRALGVAIMIALSASAASANQKTCQEEMTEIAALIEQMPDDADKHVAEYQYGKAQKFLAEGNERRCLIYLGSARGAIDAEQMDNN